MTITWRCGMALLLGWALGLPALGQENPQVRLADPLDFPREGYCIDVVGVGATARTDLPLVAHNCLPERRVADRMVVEREGQLYFPGYDACLTAFGVRAPLPGAAVILQPCGGGGAFLPRGPNQAFERTDTGQLRLAGTALCLTVGPDAAPTLSPSHRWRTLTMETCATADPALSVWE